MIIEFPRIMVTGVRTGKSAKTGNEWGRLQFFDGRDNWDVFIPSDKLVIIESLELGRTYENIRFDLTPSYNGGVNLIPTL